jgi:hypothetical protein
MVKEIFVNFYFFHFLALDFLDLYIFSLSSEYRVTDLANMLVGWFRWRWFPKILVNLPELVEADDIPHDKITDF